MAIDAAPGTQGIQGRGNHIPLLSSSLAPQQLKVLPRCFGTANHIVFYTAHPSQAVRDGALSEQFSLRPKPESDLHAARLKVGVQ